MATRPNLSEKYTPKDAFPGTEHDGAQQVRRRVLREHQRALLVRARKRFTAQQDGTAFHYCPKCGEDLKAYSY